MLSALSAVKRFTIAPAVASVVTIISSAVTTPWWWFAVAAMIR